MKKRYLFCLFAVAGAVLLSTAGWSASDFKSAIRNELVDGCMAGFISAYQQSNQSKVPNAVAANVKKACQCSIDRTLQNYSIAELKSMDRDPKKVQAFQQALQKEVLSQECLPYMMEAAKHQ